MFLVCTVRRLLAVTRTRPAGGGSSLLFQNLLLLFNAGQTLPPRLGSISSLGSVLGQPTFSVFFFFFDDRNEVGGGI